MIARKLESCRKFSRGFP